MVVFIFCIVSSIWHFYNFVGYIKPDWMLPYVQLAGSEMHLLRVINMLCLNWSPFLGLIYLAFGVAGIIVSRKTELTMDSFAYFIVVVAFLTSIGLML